MDGELAYWQAKSGLGSTVGLSAHIQAYLASQNGGVYDDIQSLYFKLYGNELSYWRTASGLPTAEFSLAKYTAINNFLNGGYGVNGYGVGGYGV